MRHLPIVLLMLAACSRVSDKDQEIAALRAQLATKAAPPPAPLPAEPRAEPVLSPEEAELMRILAVADEVPLAKILEAAGKTRVSLAQLSKNPGRFAGTPWRGSGRVLEIHEGPGGTVARVAVGPQDVMYVRLLYATDVVQYDAVDLVGFLAGSYSYTSQAGWSISLPALAAKAMVKRGKLQR